MEPGMIRIANRNCLRAFLIAAMLFLLLQQIHAAQPTLPRRDKFEHAVVLRYCADKARYKIAETWIPNKEEAEALKPLVVLDDLPKFFEFRDILVLKLSAVGRPRVWLPVTDQKVDLSRFGRGLRSVLLADFREHLTSSR